MERDNSITIHDHNLKLLAVEMYKAKNGIEPNVLGKFVTKREHRYNSRQFSDFLKDKAYSTTYGIESIRILGPKIWDLIPEEIRCTGNLDLFREKIRKWKIKHCPCRLCKVFIRGVGYL